MTVIVLHYFMLSYFQEKPRYRKGCGIFLIMLTLLFLGLLKYQSVRHALFPGEALKGWILISTFVGVPFLALRLIHIDIDFVTQQIGKIEFLNFFNYVLFFPTYLSGPIARYEEFAEQAETPPSLSAKNYYESISRIIVGCFKMRVIGDTLMSFSLDGLSPTDLINMSAGKIILSAYIYTFALYFSFSGLSDAVIGVSSLFGYEIPENFKSPLISRNLQEFWNRWHMTFIQWLRNYVYFPSLNALSRAGIRNTLLISIICILITFLLAGVWHGDGIHFVQYGLYHGVGLVIVLLYRVLLRKSFSPQWIEAYKQNLMIKYFGILMTFNFVSLGWFFFLQRTSGLRVLFSRVF